MIEAKLKADTSELDEAIVKAKMLNEELEKAKSLINNLAKNEKNEMLLTNRSFLVVEEIKPFACNVLSEEDVKRVAKEITKEMANQLQQWKS